MMTTLWKLPIASQEIVDGPEVLLRPGKLAIRFAAEDGMTHELSFGDVLKFIFTEFRACTAEHVQAYDKLVDMGRDSELAGEALVEARLDVSAYRHFRVFFDEVGAYDIVARSAEWS